MNAVITAGGTIDGAYARLSGARTKALADIRGVSMLERTIARSAQARVERIAVVERRLPGDAVRGRVEAIVDEGKTGTHNVMRALRAWPEDGEPAPVPHERYAVRRRRHRCAASSTVPGEAWRCR